MGINFTCALDRARLQTEQPWLVETPDENVGHSAVLLGMPGPPAVVQLWATVATAPALLGTPCPQVPGRAVPPRPKPAPKGARCSDAVGLGGLPAGGTASTAMGAAGGWWSSSGHEAGEGSEGEPFPAAGARGGSGAQAVLSVTGVH